MLIIIKKKIIHNTWNEGDVSIAFKALVVNIYFKANGLFLLKYEPI